MSRENIFDKLGCDNNIEKEIQRVSSLLSCKDGFVIYGYNGGVVYCSSIEQYVDAKLFLQWKARGTCLNCNDFKASVGLIGRQVDENYMLDYFEYAFNIVKVLETKVKVDYGWGGKNDVIKTNINTVLNRYGYEVRYNAKQQKALVVQKSAQATAVAEILPTDLATLVIEYNHYTLKGKIERKKDILIALGAALEAKRKELNSINKSLADKIFFILNNLNIRHNNVEKGHKGYNESVAKMTETELENWYDELYQMILLAYLLMDNQDRNAKVEELICRISSKEKK